MTNEQVKLVQVWEEVRERAAEARRRLISADCDLANAMNAVAMALMPKDAKPGEKFAVWDGGRLIEVTCTETNPWHGTVRVRS